MENATKALLIAAAILIAVMILSLLLIGYNGISDYYAARHESKIKDQLAEFNSKFENYHRDKIRGTDIISLMNRIIDYNETYSYQEGTAYKRIAVTISLGNQNIINQFKYNESDESIINTDSNGNITNTLGNDRINDLYLIEITETESDLLNKLSVYVQNPKTSQLQSLSTNISNIMIDENNTQFEINIRNREKRKALLKSILKIDINTDEDTAITSIEHQNMMEDIKEIACTYYQYTQFKRAYFDCTEVIHDQETGRVCEMNFKLRTKSNGNIEFN